MGGGMGGGWLVFNGDKFSFTRQRVLGMNGSDGCTIMWMYFVPLNCIVMVKRVNAMYILPHTQKETAQHPESGVQWHSNKRLLILPHSAISKGLPRHLQQPQLSLCWMPLAYLFANFPLKHKDILQSPYTRDPDGSVAELLALPCTPLAPSHILTSAYDQYPSHSPPKWQKEPRVPEPPFHSSSMGITYVKHPVSYLAPSRCSIHWAISFIKLPQGPEVCSNHQNMKQLELGKHRRPFQGMNAHRHKRDSVGTEQSHSGGLVRRNAKFYWWLRSRPRFWHKRSLLPQRAKEKASFWLCREGSR